MEAAERLTPTPPSPKAGTRDASHLPQGAEAGADPGELQPPQARVAVDARERAEGVEQLAPQSLHPPRITGPIEFLKRTREDSGQKGRLVNRQQSFGRRSNEGRATRGESARGNENR